MITSVTFVTLVIVSYLPKILFSNKIKSEFALFMYHVMFSPGMAALDSRASGKMGLRAVVYYTSTTVIAVFIGIVMVLIIHPGKGSRDEFTKHQKVEQVNTADAFLDLIR